MFRYLKIIYNYVKLFVYISYINYRKIDISNNIEWIDSIQKIINNGGFMLIKSVQWLLPSYSILYPDTLLYKKFYEMYEHTDKILIPEVYYCTEKLMIMEYIEGEEFKPEILGEYQSYKYLMLLIIFTNNSCLNGFAHGDIHSGNWKVNDGSLIIYDFGYCFSIDYNEYDILNELISIDEKENINQKFFDYYLNKEFNSHVNKDIINSKIHYIIDEHLKVYPLKLYIFINILIKFCLKNNILISVTCINGLLLFLQLIEIFNKVKILECQATYESYLLDILNHSKVNNMTPKLIEYIEQKIDENDSQSIMTDNFERFEGLKKFM